MAFDVNRYKKVSNLTPTDRAVNTIVKGVVNASTGSAADVAAYTARSMIESGLSQTGASNITANRTDSVRSMSSSTNRDISGDTSLRATPEAISRNRNPGSGSLNHYLQNVNPSTKISNKRKAQNPQILSIYE